MVKLAFVGFVLGITTTIPGISAATMAVVFNVYERLINLIVPNVKKVLGAWAFWLPLVVGGGIGIVFASKALTVLFENYEVWTYWFFIGVIVGSIPLIYSRARKTSSALPSFSSAICAVIAFALMIIMAVLKPEEGVAVYTQLSPSVFGLLAFSGALGALAMIIPGISGAFLLLVIGMYRTVLQAVSELNIPLILPVILGAGLGLLIGAAFVRFLLNKAPKQTYGAVLGFVAGSVIVLYPSGFGEGIGIIVSAATFSSGFAFSFIMGKKER
ncbi:MAG: DUF368 domain-containing protein [Chitinivibrionia bacterium]|nr:DUF368 domain-containing protein [Chitinivibrionia bacterium]